MFTPISTASTGPALTGRPGPVTTGSSTRTAGRLLTTFASAAASTVIASNAGSDDPPGISRVIAAPRPLATTASTTTPRPSTKSRKGMPAARTRLAGVAWRLARPRAASRHAPANAAQAGLSPAKDVITNPASVAATVTSGNSGTGESAAGWGRAGGTTARSRLKNRRNARYSIPIAATHGSAISPAKCVSVIPATEYASRLVRLDTGSSSDAEFAR